MKTPPKNLRLRNPGYEHESIDVRDEEYFAGCSEEFLPSHRSASHLVSMGHVSEATKSHEYGSKQNMFSFEKLKAIYCLDLLCGTWQTKWLLGFCRKCQRLNLAVGCCYRCPIKHFEIADLLRKFLNIGM